MFSFGNKDAILEVNLDSHDLEWVFPMWRTCHLWMLIMYRDRLDCFDLWPAEKKMAWGSGRWIMVDELWWWDGHGETDSSLEGLRMFAYLVLVWSWCNLNQLIQLVQRVKACQAMDVSWTELISSLRNFDWFELQDLVVESEIVVEDRSIQQCE